MAKNRVLNEGAFTQDTKNIINHNFSDVSLCTTQFDAVTGTTGVTLTNVVGMVTDPLAGGGTYKFRIIVPTVATANCGSKFAFKQSITSMISSIEYEAKAFTASAVAVSRGTTATDQALLCDNAAAAVILVEIMGVVVIAAAGAGGTLQFQAAQHTAHADTMSVFAKAQMEFAHITTG